MSNYRTEVGRILQGNTTSADVLATQVGEHQRLSTVESLPEMTEIVGERGHPQLMLIQLASGAITGVVLLGTWESSIASFADTYAERDEVHAAIRVLRDVAPMEAYGSWTKVANVDAASLDEAIASTPESRAGQKFVLLYRDDEWQTGIWNNPVDPRDDSRAPRPGLALHSVADFYGTRVSAVKRAQRAPLAVVRTNQVLAGQYGVLEGAIRLFRESRQGPRRNQKNEAHPAVRHLCTWWNGLAPQGSREAAVIRLYVWDEASLHFEPCDPEEPVALASQVATWTSYALFEAEDRPTVLIDFQRGRKFNQDDGDCGTKIFAADGTELTSIGLEPDEVDEAYYSVIGLKFLSEGGGIV